jgi:hypothetical protein
MVSKEYSNELKGIIALMLAKESRLRPDSENLLGNKYIVLHLSKKLAKQSNVPLLITIVLEEKTAHKGLREDDKIRYKEERRYKIKNEDYKLGNEYIIDAQAKKHIEVLNKDKVDKYTFDIEKYKFDNRNKFNDVKPILQRESNKDVQKKYSPILGLKPSKEFVKEKSVNEYKPKTPHNFYGIIK